MVTPADMFGEFDPLKWGDMDYYEDEAEKKTRSNAWSNKISILPENPVKIVNATHDPGRPSKDDVVVDVDVDVGVVTYFGRITQINGKCGVITAQSKEKFAFTSVTQKMIGIQHRDRVSFEIGKKKKNGMRTVKNITPLRKKV
tara:strand:+ start:367 stop:795 length:429 start_codon:yes stop_codon:yes gene_type:complete